MGPESPYRRLHSLLWQAAQQRAVITDREAMAALGWNDHGLARRMQFTFLLRSMAYEHAKLGLPFLTAVVVRATTGRPPGSFYEFARDVKRLSDQDDEDIFWLRELTRVYGFWQPDSRTNAA